MQDIRITVASLKSILIDLDENLRRVEAACAEAQKNQARLIVLPELMLTGHGGHHRMIENAKQIPDGHLTQTIVSLSRNYNLCICVGIAELSHQLVYNSQIVVDKGNYLGLQRKIYLSEDEYCYFSAGNSVEVFDI